MLYLFEGGRLTADEGRHIELQADELRSYAFHDARELSDLTTPLLVSRTVAGIEARADGVTAYLEHEAAPEAAA